MDNKTTYSTPPEPTMPIVSLENCTFGWYRKRHRKFSNQDYSYDEGDEPGPEHPYFRQVDQDKLARLIQRLQDVAMTCVGPIFDPDEQLQAIRSLATRAARLQHGDNISVVVTGIDNSGRSTLINGIMGTTAKLCAIGHHRSATISPMSLTFREGPSEDQNNYSATVHVVSHEDTTAEVTHHTAVLQTYREIQQKHDSLDGTRALRFSCLTSLGLAENFALKLQGCSHGRQAGVTTQDIPEDPEEYKKACFSWTKHLTCSPNVQPCINDESASSSHAFSCDSIENLVKKLEPYVSEPLSFATKNIEVSLSAPRQFEGLELIDVPSTRIVDGPRQPGVQCAMERSDLRLICATSKHLWTREAYLHTEIMRTISAVGHRNTCLLVTKIDEIRDFNDWYKDNMDWLSKIDQEPIASLVAFNEANNTKIETPDRNTGAVIHPYHGEDRVSRHSRDSSPDVREGYKKYLKQLIRTAVISYECGRLRNEWTDECRNRGDNTTINIFFLSGQSYMSSKKFQKRDDRPILYGAASGVPALRSHLLCLAGGRRLNSSQRHATESIARFYMMIERVCFKIGHQDDLDKLGIVHMHNFDQWQSSLEPMMDSHISQSLEDGKLKMLGPVEHSQTKGKKLAEICKDWQTTLEPQVYAMICASGGTAGTHFNDGEHWIIKINRALGLEQKAWRTSYIKLVQEIAFEQDIKDRDQEICIALHILHLHPAVMRHALFDWEIAKTRTEHAIAQFRAKGVDAIKKLHETLTNTSASNPTAAVAQIMRPILKQGVYRPLHVTLRIGSVKFLQDVAELWKCQTKEKLRAPVRALGKELLDISKTWFESIKLLQPLDQQLSCESESVRERLRGRLDEMRDIANEIGRTVLLEEPLIPDLA